MASRAPPPTPPSLDMASLSGNARSKASNWAVPYKGRAEHALYVVFASSSARSPVSAYPLRQCPRPLHQRSICSALHRRLICIALHWPLDLHRHKNRLAHRAEVSVCVFCSFCATTSEGRKGKVTAAPVEQGNGFTCSPAIGEWQ